MTQPIQALIDEHRRIRSMLGHFEAQLDRFERPEKPDYDILGGSIAYCHDYLDRWHHPLEDALLSSLSQRAPAEARAWNELEAQHLKLSSTTVDLVKTFDEVEHGAEYLRANLVKLGRSLVGEYLRHLDWEEKKFFPSLIENSRPKIGRQRTRAWPTERIR